MCDSISPTNISRRSFGGMAAAAASLALLPSGARAADVDHLAIQCIDFRLVNYANGFFNGKSGPREKDKFDLISLAGASLAGATTGMFNATKAGFWQQMDVAIPLHTIQRVWVLDHMSCGAYEAEFNGGRPMPPAVERQKHIETMGRLKSEFARHYPRIPVEFYLAAAPGTHPYPAVPERIVI